MITPPCVDAIVDMPCCNNLDNVTLLTRTAHAAGRRAYYRRGNVLYNAQRTVASERKRGSNVYGINWRNSMTNVLNNTNQCRYL